MKKRGSHVGRVLSFVIFIIFVSFLYTTLQPAIKDEKSKEYFLEYLRIELNENLSIKVKGFNLAIISGTNKKCIVLEDFFNFTEETKKIIINDVNESSKENISISESEKNNAVFRRQSKNSDFFKIYYSEEFEEIGDRKTEGCIVLKKDEDYEISGNFINKKIYIKKLNELIKDYNADYIKTKTKLSIPEGIDFGFAFELENSTIIQTKEIRTDKNIYAEQYPIQYLNNNAEIKSGFLTIRVW